MERMKTRLKRVFLFMLSALMLFTSLPLSVFAKVNYDNLTDNKSEIVNNKVPVKPVKLGENQTAEDLIKNPDQPAIYTLRTDFKVQRGEKYQVDYQPYIASVGAAASNEEKAKVNKTMPMPDIAGYDKPQDNFTIDYKTIKDAADGKNKTGNDVNGLRYSANKEFNYSAKSNKIQIKHVFQDLEDFTKYTNPDGSVGDKGALIITQNGNTGSTMQASPLSESDPRRKGFIPEADYINMQVPENAKDFILEYRYNRVHYDVVFDTQGGTPLPTRTLYYGQEMPKIADADIPTKVGGDFLGWKPSVDLTTKDGKTYKANEIIKVGTGSAIEKLDNDLIMPASNVTFTAVWKDKEKADYAVQFWAEKADHADGASLADKYDYMGTRVYKDKDTGSRPDLDNEPVKDIVFPDLDQKRLNKIWNGARFNRGKDLYLNKFYVYNKDLTHEQNVDPTNVNLVKSVDSTGKTVYNIYYDRQVYDLYFTKSNIENSFYPEIWGYDEAKGEPVKKGGPGNPYHYKARFNQLMLGWPNDAMQTKGFDKDMQSFGWGPNYVKPQWPEHLDTPPYRLNADQFLDMEKYDEKGGYVKTIDKGDGTSINLPWYDFTTLSFGIKQADNSMPHHMDFWMDGFKPGETIIRYDLYRSKADTNSDTYAPKYPKVQGFTPYGYKPGGPWPTIVEGNQENGRVDGDGINELNAERAAVTPFPAKTYTVFGDELPLGKMRFISAFFNNADEFGDPDGWDGFDTNGYLRFKYTRNKYPLRFNYDPAKIKGDNEFGPTNQLQTFYEFPLKALSPKVDTKNEYKKDKPANLLDNPENLKTLGLTDLIFTDPADGKLKVKRPDNLSDQMVFKGWALDPAGTKLIWENPGEKMPNHPVNLYAKWGEPDYQWKVTFDPNGGNLSSIDEAKVTQKRKTIQVGDKGQEETKTFAQKEANVDNKQVFTVIQRQKLVEPKKPTRKGYDFMGWEVIHYKKDNKGDYTNEIDNSYRETYKVPELYSFGNDVVSPIYLKAIWVPNDRVDVKVVHHIMSLDLKEETKKITETLHNKRTGYLVATSGDKQDEEKILATHEELEEKLTGDLKTLYEEYNKRVGANNTYFQTFKVEPEKIDDGNGNLVPNPKFKDNVFHFFYRPFRTRDYKVNYIDERFKDDPENGKIIDQELVSNGNRHYDARNYRQIPGWKLVSDPQQQLFFDVNEETNAFLGINGTGKDEITFYYKDVRVIEVPKDGKTPEGYVRVTFKADKGGSFGKDDKGNDITELNYDVIKGLQSQLLPVPKELAEGETADKDKHYITPETGKKFIKWDKSPLLNDNTIINEAHTFTAYFEWSGLSASGLVRTEAFKDTENKWTNDFAPTIDQLKSQLVWMEKGKVAKLPAGAVIKLYDENNTELTTDEQVYELVNEKKKADKDELVRTVNIKAKVTFKDGKDPQELDIPITVYKNVYEALNKEGDKPLFLKEAEGKDAKDGGLKDILKDNDGNRYIKVTIKPNKDFTNKDDKVYYVNPNAWVEIPNDSNGTAALINWTADQDAQNENKAANGKFDFAKRHKFTKDTVISPRLSQTSELVVHESYKDSKNKWVNDFIDKELTDANLKAAIQVKNGEVKALGDGDTVTIVDDAGNPYADDAALKAALYEKLQEKDDGGKVSRIENIKVKVTFANGEVQTVTVPVKVIKNIYQAKTEAGMPDYVPANYVKVTLDPTTKAKDPQKYFYYVNPDAKVLIPGKDPEGVKEDFTGWTMKADSATGAGTSYKLKDRHQFAEDSTIIAQYGQGKAKIKYVDENKNDIDPNYHIDGVDYPTEKIGKLGDNVPDPAYNQGAEKAAAPKFKGYIISNVSVDKKPANYTDPATATITYQYNKKVTTDDKSSSMAHFPVVFDANTGAFTGGEAKVTVYVYCKGSGETYEDVTFEEVRQAVEEKYGIPSKADESFIEWQDKDTKGTKVDAGYVIKLKDPNNWDVAEVFYANYGKASALVKYLDLNGKPIDDKFKIDGVEYPSEKAGTADEAIPSDVFTKDSAPKFTGYKFNRIELNPKDGKYALSKKATIKIYYEKDSDVIPAKDGSGNPNEKPNGYVEVKFVPTDKAKDTTEKIFYVNPKKDVTIPIANPEAKATFTFKEWKMGAKADGAVYTPSTPKKFTEKETVITATYEETKNIIPYDPSATDPMVRPDGYVRVSFAADDGLSLTDQKAYYVKKNAGIKLGNAELAKPGYKAETGYEFTKWDKEDSLEIKDQDVLVTAKATVLKDVDTENHPGYVKVTFVAGANGVIKENGNKINEKVYYVNPTKYVNLTAPTPEGNTGYDFGAWKSDKSQSDFSLANFVNYKEDTTITAMFNQKEAVYPKLDGSTKPAGYVEVTFAITGTNGKIAESEVKTYYVDPTRQVSLKAPKTVAGTGFIFDKWRLGTNPSDQVINPADQRQYSKDTTIYGSFTKLKDIIPATNDDGTPNLQPIDYVAVLFIGGDHANKLDGQILYYVNPKANPAQTIGNLTKPKVTPDTGWKHTGWDVKDSTPIKDYIFVVAEYEALDDVIPKTKADDSEKPAGYVKVTFKAGANGTLQGGEKTYFVNPAKYVKLTPPTTVPNTSYEFSTWESDGKDFILANNINYTKDTIITAKFNTKGDVIPKTKHDDSEKPQGFVTVTFVIDPTDAGKIEAGQTITYFVRPNTDLTIQPPKTKANTGYEFEKWDPDTTEVKKYTTDTTVKGEFKKLVDIIPSKNPDGTVNAKPEGYVIVNFLKGDHGVLDGQTTFYVNPKAKKTIKDINPTITVVPSPTYKHDGWDTDFATVIDKDTKVTAKYTQLPNIIKAGPKDTAPDGYVVIIFETDGRGTITGNKAYEDKTNPKANENEIVYFVNPKKNIKLAKLADGVKPADDQLAIPSTTPNDSTKYIFDQWRTDIDTTTPITRGRVHIAMFKPKEVKLTYDKNGADVTGEVPPVLTVDYDANVRLAGKGNLAKKDASFKGWKIGEKTYQAGDQINLKEDTTAYAQWTNDENIIPYDPVNKPTTRPDDTYVRVTFAAEDGLKLKEQKAYYVKKDAGIKLGDTNLAKPGYTVETGYKFDKWDKEDSLVITEDILVTAKSTKLGTVIPEKDKNGNTNAKPEGYKEVVFVVKAEDATKGSLEGNTKFYVNPTEYVTINPPTTKANTGFEFGAWDKELKQKFTAETTTITAQYEPLADVVPQEKTDGSDKPSGYKTVTFKADAKGSLSGKTVYYVNPEKTVDLTSKANNITKNPNTGYTAEGGTWKNSDSKKLNDTFNKDTEFVFNFAERPDVIKKIDDNTKLPNGYVTVKFIPTDKATDETKADKVYFVNPLKEVTITETPVGTQVKDANDVSYDYKFTGWTVTRGAINSWKGSTVSDKFIQDTDITAKYSVKIGNIMPLPLAKDNAVTAIKDKPEAKDLIKNPGDLPKGTTFAYTADGEPKVDETGKTTAKVEVKYPNGKTTIVKVPVLVVDNVVEQKANVKPPVPDSYIKVTVDPTDAATDNTNNKKIFWVKPNTEVKLDGIYDPIGKDIVEGKVTKPNKFTKWTLKDSDPVVEYKVVANSITTSFAKESTIIANYENVENIPPEGKYNPLFSQYSKPEPKDFIKNVYDDNDPNNKYNLPPGTKFAFQGGEPDTSKVGGNTATILVTYPNGEVKDIKVNYNVTGNVVEKLPGEEPPVPDNFVTVIVKTTDKATEDVTRTFRVNPEKVVTITVTNPSGKKVDKTQTSPEIQYEFKGWQSDENPVRTWAESISGQFTAKVTTITAQYEEKIGQPGIVDAGMYYTSESLSGVNNYLPSEDELKALVKSQVQGDIEKVSILTTDFNREVYDKLKENGKLDREEISRTETIKAKITFVNGSTKEIDIPIVVYKNIYEGLTNGAKPQYVAQAEHDLKKSNPGRNDNDYVRVTLIPTAKAKNQQRKTYYVRKNASVIIPEIIAEGRDAYQFMYWEAETRGKGQNNPNYGWATRSIAMFRSAEPINKDDLVNDGKIIDKVDGNTRMSFDQDTDIVAQYKTPTPTPTPTPDEPDKPNPDYPKYPDYPEYRPNYSGGSTIYIEKPVEKVIKVPDNAFVKEVRYMQGFEGKFRPFDGLTRAEAAQILANALKEDGYKYDPNYKISYKDIGNAWYTEAVKIVTQANVFKGYDDGNFKPQEKITRAEWIGTLKRFQELSDLSGNHMNLREGHWAMAEIEAAYQAGWLAIYSDGLADFKADEFIPRQEVAAVSNKAFERVLDKTYIKRNDKALVNYKDINDKMWSYEDILCASNTFLHDKKLYRAHGIDMSNEIFNINLDGFTITKDKFQRIER